MDSIYPKQNSQLSIHCLAIRHYLFSSAFPTLASGASIARGRPPPNGGARLAPSLRSRWDNIGQKPEPTYLFFAEMKTDCYFESEEGKKAFAEWMEKKNALQNEKLVAQSKKDGE